MIYSIQYLRALAATAVVVMHVGYIFGCEWRPLAAGVDLFFLISGFIMWSVTAGKDMKFGTFLTHRLIKIVPLYWLFTVIFVIASEVSPGSFGNFLSTPLQIVMSLLFIPYYGRNGDMEPALGVGWTLNYEMFFYLIFALSLLVRERYRLPCILAALISFVLARELPFHNAPFGLFTSPMLLEFAAGISIAAWYRSGRSLQSGVDLLLIALGIAGIALSFMAPPEGGFARVVMWGLPAAVVLVGSLSYERNGSVRHIEFLKTLGDASYAIYLSHLITIGVCKYLFSKIGLERWGVPLSQQLLLAAFTFLASMAVGLLCYYVFDRPSHDFLRERVSRVWKKRVVTSALLLPEST